MGDLIEIQIDGRGGQGNVVAAYMLAQAAFEAGRFAQAFPTFGPERRGAPVASYVRVSDRPIRRRCQVREPLYLMIQDPSLLRVAGVVRNVRRGGGVLINSSRDADKLGLSLPGRHVTCFPATAMASEMLGEAIPNTALLAALLNLTELLPLTALEAVLVRRFAGEALQRNLSLMRAAASRVPAGAWKEGSDVSGN